jgi:hypothetical protein
MGNSLLCGPVGRRVARMCDFSLASGATWPMGQRWSTSVTFRLMPGYLSVYIRVKIPTPIQFDVRTVQPARDLLESANGGSTRYSPAY